MQDEPKDWSVVRYAPISKAVYIEDGLTKAVAIFLASQNRYISPGDSTFAIPTALRKQYFADLLESLRLAQSEHTK